MGSPALDVRLSRPKALARLKGNPVVKKRVEVERSLLTTILFALLLSGVTAAAVVTITHTEKLLFAIPAALALAVIAGRLLGERVWPALGVGFSSIVLRGYAAWGRRRSARLLLTPFADFMPGRLRQAWESTAFASGIALILGASMLLIFEGRPGSLIWFCLGLLAVASVMTFLLVPHWAFARLGLRISEPDRFVTRSLAESYDRIVRVSNGTILLFAVFYGVSILADRATRFEWYFTVLTTLLAILGLGVVVTGTAAAYFKRHEEHVIKRVAAEARRLGFVPVRLGRLGGGGLDE